MRAVSSLSGRNVGGPNTLPEHSSIRTEHSTSQTVDGKEQPAILEPVPSEEPPWRLKERMSHSSKVRVQLAAVVIRLVVKKV